MIAVDTNLLVYSHREDSPWHKKALHCVTMLAEGRGAWAIPWPCLHEFFAIATHPRIYKPPTPVEQAVAQIDAWLESPTVVLLGETEEHWQVIKQSLLAGLISGPKVHDGRIAAICIQHGVRELWSADRDFTSFPNLVTRNPLVG